MSPAERRATARGLVAIGVLLAVVGFFAMLGSRHHPEWMPLAAFVIMPLALASLLAGLLVGFGHFDRRD